MPGLKRNRVYAPRIQSNKRYKYVASRGSNLSNYVPSKLTRVRRRGSTKYRRSFTAVRRRRGRRSSGSSRGLTLAKVIRSLTPLNSVSYAIAGKVQPGVSNGNGPVCAYYIPNNRASATAWSSVPTPLLGDGQVIINGSGTTQIFPSLLDVQALGVRVSSVDNSSTVATGTSFFSPSVQFYIGNYKCVTKMVNQSNSQACVQVYTCQLRKNLPSSQPSIYNLIRYGMLDKLIAADNSVSYAITTTSSDDYMRDDQLSPFDSSTFCSYVKITSVKKMVIDAGDMRILTHSKRGMIKVKPSMFCTVTQVGNTWLNAPADNMSIKGGVFQFFKVTGQPTNDVTNKSALGYTSPVIDFVHDYSFNYRYVVETGATTNRFGAFGFGVVAPSVMTEQGNVVAAAASA